MKNLAKGRLQKLMFAVCWILFLGMQVTAQAQNVTVTGTVLGLDGEPLAGAIVAPVGTTIATSTDTTGAFRISFPAKIRTLEVSFVGMETQVVSVAGKTSVQVTLSAAHTNLDQVVVVGYGTQRKEAVTGSVASIGRKAA